MPDNQNSSAQIPVKLNSFSKSMVKDLSDMYLGEGVWSHARNAVNTTHRGDEGVISNEASTEILTQAPYVVTGLIHHHDTVWLVFSTNELTSELGLFDEHLKTYQVVVSSTELNLSKQALITGVIKPEYDSTFTAYWQDGLNPDRCVNLTNLPFHTTGRNLSPDPDCFIPEYTTRLDVDQLLLHPKLTLPKLSLTRNPGGGQLPAGSYQTCVAYSVKGIRVTDYFTPSNTCSLWSHGGGGGSLRLDIESLDPTFDEFELVLVSTVNSQTVAKKIGYYSIRQNTVLLDQALQSLPTVPISLISLQNPIYHKSDGMHELNGYLIRSGVSTRPDFNYQLQANQIQTQWVSVRYPADYYANSGTSVGYLRDEVYAFFIRWVYDTGMKSASYHIPGRASSGTDKDVVTGADVLTGETQRWQVYDTSTANSISGITPDGGQIIYGGPMQYWESTEKYPDEQPLVWGSLCGKPIRHHKFPTNSIAPHFSNNGETIEVLGVQFFNITHPLDEKGNPIRDIVGYEILRGSREGNKSVIAKGLLSNLVEYDIEGNTSVKGLYSNYPYNDLRPDKFLLQRDHFSAGHANPDDNVFAVTRFQNQQFSFHGPDTAFDKPFLSGSYLQVYGETSGTVTGNYEYVHNQPKQKLVTNFAFVNALIAGMGITILESIGVGHMSTEFAPSAFGFSLGSVLWERSGGMATALPDGVANAIMSPATTLTGAAIMMLGSAIFGGSGLDKAMDLIYKMSPGRNYCLQYNSHGFYNQFQAPVTGHRRREISQGLIKYVGPHVQDFSNAHRINNWSRSPMVAMKVTAALNPPLVQDNTRQRLQDTGNWSNPTKEFTTTASSHYVALKVPSDAQYGQLDAVVQVPMHSGVFLTSLTGATQSSVLFGGDIYITRYTEKNPYFFFNKWLVDVPDYTPYDLRQGQNGPPARYWASFDRFDFGDMGLDIDFDTSSYDDSDFDGEDGLSGNIVDDPDSFSLGPLRITIGKPSDLHSLDQDGSSDGTFTVKEGYVYFFCNGVRDFFVESEKNLAFRDYKEEPGGRHYSPYDHYADLSTMFRADLIKRQQLLLYDQSLSVGKLYFNYQTWGTVVGRDFDPLTQASRFTYFKDRVIFSLQHQAGLKRDNWKSFLANNYKDFGGKVVNQIKALNATGALILFENAEPVQFVGVDQLQTGAGVKISVGDGGLFQQNLQSVVNADDSLERGSCQSKRSAVNTPYGLFWVSQKTSKIFLYQSGSTPLDITTLGMSRWFGEYLPSKLLQQFPNFPYSDNPVAGVGCQAIFDPLYELVYFSKRDFELKPEFVGWVAFLPGDHEYFEGFHLQDKNDPGLLTEIALGDPRYFNDVSWTISFDPKEQSKGWVSFHDWIPSLVIPSYQHFVSVKNKSFYRHNTSTTSYGNFYGVDYPFEIEVPVSTGSEVSVLKSVEYQLEAYTYTQQGKSAFAVLDANFDRAMLYNNEQGSGWLKLVPEPKNNPVLRLSYPKMTSTGLEILVSKEEQKYRFNQFWDLTKDRGEFSGRRVPLFKWDGNGTTRTLNSDYFDFNKPPTQRKKFRHYAHRLLLKRLVSNEVNYLLRLTNLKISSSAR